MANDSNRHAEIGLSLFERQGLPCFPSFLFTTETATMIHRKTRVTDGTRDQRSGATLVELAIVLPVFFLLVFAFIEFGHVFMTIHVLNGAAKSAARVGVGDNSTTDEVKARANEILGGLLNPTTMFKVEVLDGSVFDDPDVDPTSIDYNSLAEIDLSEAEPRQIFIVRVSVPYDNISIWGPAGPKWVRGINITGMSVLRHE